jgi:hypothetical protein
MELAGLEPATSWVRCGAAAEPVQRGPGLVVTVPQSAHSGSRSHENWRRAHISRAGRHGGATNLSN